MIKLLRVDYRLVHGQVAISWSRHIGADCILVANDEVAKDEMRQSMLRLSKPQGMKLVIKSIEDSVKSIKSGVTDKYKMFIVCLLYTSPSPRDKRQSRMPSSA